MLTNALSAKAVASLKDGKHRDGQGLQFEVKGGSRRWTFSYMFDGRQRELAIGKYPAMSLADARATVKHVTEGPTSAAAFHLELKPLAVAVLAILQAGDAFRGECVCEHLACPAWEGLTIACQPYGYQHFSP